MTRRNMALLHARRTAPAMARGSVVEALQRWGFGADLTADVVLVTSELVTNAVLASRPGAPVYLVLAYSSRWLLLSVADASPRFPVAMPPSAERPGGHGLEIVAGLSGRWGWHRVRFPGLIKTVWAEFPTL